MEYAFLLFLLCGKFSEKGQIEYKKWFMFSSDIPYAFYSPFWRFFMRIFLLIYNAMIDDKFANQKSHL